MAQAYLDSAGNVNTAVAEDVQNLVMALRQQAVLTSAPATLAAAAAVVAADAITGLTSAAVTDV